MYEQATIPVQNSYGYRAIAQAVERELSPAAAARFLSRVSGHRLRVRDFAGVLASDLLGRDTRLQYETLPDSDRAQIRELYLSLVEKVPVELRAKFLKIYAYY